MHPVKNILGRFLNDVRKYNLKGKTHKRLCRKYPTDREKGAFGLHENFGDLTQNRSDSKTSSKRDLKLWDDT